MAKEASYLLKEGAGVDEVEQFVPFKERSLIADIFMSLLEPGVNRGLLVLLHFSFISLIVSNAVLLYMVTDSNEFLQVSFLLCASVILYICILWFVHVLISALRIHNYQVKRDDHAKMVMTPDSIDHGTSIHYLPERDGENGNKSSSSSSSGINSSDEEDDEIKKIKKSSTNSNGGSEVYLRTKN